MGYIWVRDDFSYLMILGLCRKSRNYDWMPHNDVMFLAKIGYFTLRLDSFCSSFSV